MSSPPWGWLLTRQLQPIQRVGVLSAAYLLSYLYLSMGATATALGAVATASRPGLAVDLGAGVITVLAVGSRM
jgi:hypothetical protein